MANEETDDISDSSTDNLDQDDSSNQNGQEVDTDSNGSEVDTNTDEGKDKTVPYDRFHEVNESKKQAEERARKAEEELEALKSNQQTSDKDSKDSDDDIEPDVEKLLDSYAKKKGFVSQSELQVRNDVQDLKLEYAKSGIPFDDRAIYDYSKKNGLPIPNSKEGWRAMYKALNHESILEAERKKAVIEYRNGNKSTAEKPGPGGAKKPNEEKLPTRRERIHAAAQKVFGS